MSNFFMNIDTNKIPAANWQQRGLAEYLLVAHVDTQVNHKIQLEKEYFSDKYQVPSSSKKTAQSVIANFTASEAMEPTLRKWMQHAIASQPGFLVTMDKFGGFPSHTIYLGVHDSRPFQQLARQLIPINDYIRNSDCPAVKFKNIPFLNIANSFIKRYYTKGYDKLQQTNF